MSVNVTLKDAVTASTSIPAIANVFALSQLMNRAQLKNSGALLHAHASAKHTIALIPIIMLTLICILMRELAGASVLPNHANLIKFGTRPSALANAAHRLAQTISIGTAPTANVFANLSTVMLDLPGALRTANANAKTKHAKIINTSTMKNANVNASSQKHLANLEKSLTTKLAHVFVNHKPAKLIHSGVVLNALAFAPQRFAQAV